MRRAAVFAFLMAAMVIGFGCAPAPAPQSAEPAKETASTDTKEPKEEAKKESKSVNALFEEARTRAKEQKKLMLVSFSADWCSPCQEMHKAMKENSALSAEVKNFEVFEVDYDAEESKDLKGKFYPDGGIPFVILLRPEDESRVADMLGFDSPESMTKILEAARAKA